MDNKESQKTLSLQTVQRIYDLIGKRYDWFGMYDAKAKECALERLNLVPGLHILDVGMGSGKEHVRIQSAVEPGGSAIGIDISWQMLSVSHRRCHSPLCQADARFLPFRSDYFDRIYVAYVLDLMAVADLPNSMQEFKRVLKPGGCLVIAALTEGINSASRMLVATWKAVYAISPVVCAGCRPLQLMDFLKNAGFSSIQREVIVQLAVPSEIVTAQKDDRQSN
jgi:demethylmenaquinone methyltransferase/2-methoxy-6-polyprenyl-1,4-benzoquinol methylase